MFQTEAEHHVGSRLADVFDRSLDPIEVRLANFPRYARRAQVTRFLALYELFKLVLPVKGSVVECGVFRGFSLFSWAKFSAILEPNNLTRRIYGFDSFAGFPAVSAEDAPERTSVEVGDLATGGEEELRELMQLFEMDRFLGHIPKMDLISGRLEETLPRFLADNQQLVISLLFLDVDLYEPTRLALELLMPRIPRGGIIAFDELDNPLWPGETRAAMDVAGLGRLELRRFEFDPYIAFARIE
jgi:hypothetical protein